MTDSVSPGDLRAGAEVDLATLCREYEPFIRRALRRHYVSAEELDDVTHDVFVVLLRKLDADSRPRSIRAWLYQIARRVAANHHRHHRRRSRKDEAVRTLTAPQTVPTAEDLVARRQAHSALRNFIESLDEEACAVFVMSEVEGLRGAEIASRLGISLPMTYARIRTVRARFERRVVGRKQGARAAMLGWRKSGIAAVAAVAFAVGRRTKIVAGVAALLGLLWLLRGLSPGSGSSTPTAPTPGPGTPTPPALHDADAARASLDDSNARQIASARGSATFGGIVVDREGRAIRGAVVCADRIRVPGHLLTDPPLCTHTAADGRFAIPGASDEPHTLAAMADGFAPGYSHVAPRSDVRIVLHAGGTELSGRVEDVFGGPVADAWVAVENLAEDTLGASVRTDDDGRFTMWVVEGPVPVAAGAQDYATSFSMVLAPSSDIRIRLGAESIISGVVVNAGGAPVPDVRVSALLLPGPDQATNRGASTHSDAQGRWELRGLQPHQYVLDASGPQSWGRAPEPIDLGIGDRRTGVKIEMIEGADIVGRIVDAQTGRPCPEGFVTTLDKNASITREGRTDADGWVVIPSLSGNATYRLTVSCRGYESRELDVEATMGPGSPHQWELTVGRTLAVKLLAAGGEPLPDWRVRILMPKGHRLFDHRPTWRNTGSDGLAEFTGLPDGTYEVRADGPGGGPLGAHEAVVQEAYTELEITARTGVVVSGRVVDDEGEPLRQAVVTLQSPIPEFSPLWGPSKEQRQQLYGGGPFRATTDGNGEFRVPTTPAGTYNVYVVSGPPTAALLARNAIDNPFALAEEKPVRQIEVGTETLRVELQVDALETIAGVVSDEQDDRLRGARVFVMLERDGKIVHARSRPQLTDDEGQFEFEDLQPGTYAVAAYRPGGGVARLSGVEAGTESADLVFPRLGRIEGRAETGEGSAVAGYQLFVRRDDEKRPHFVPVGSRDGRFSLGGLTAGRYHLRVQTETAGATAEVVLAEGEHKRGVKLTVEPRTLLSGRLVDEESAPLDGWHVAAVVADAPRTLENVRVHGITRSDGTFEFEDVPVEPLAILASPTSSPEALAAARQLATVEPAAGERNEVGDIVAP